MWQHNLQLCHVDKTPPCHLYTPVAADRFFNSPRPLHRSGRCNITRFYVRNVSCCSVCRCRTAAFISGQCSLSVTVCVCDSACVGHHAELCLYIVGRISWGSLWWWGVASARGREAKRSPSPAFLLPLLTKPRLLPGNLPAYTPVACRRSLVHLSSDVCVCVRTLQRKHAALFVCVRALWHCSLGVLSLFLQG